MHEIELKPTAASLVITVRTADKMHAAYGLASPVSGTATAIREAREFIRPGTLVPGTAKPKTAIDIAKARWDEAAAVAEAFRAQLVTRSEAHRAAPTPATIGAVNDALAQLAAAKRATTQAHTLYRSLDQRKTA